ncbi:EfeM/EfeO family lipoprotein [Streptomyces liangshanensis]|uniref:EfeM/EfeO family lipoprotein n=1 Tax=Streptomyces liangshanensis TaxID=2717324 RepID=UPI001FBB4913|nr:EfeM/EfeO family lipoprotein [Streptomyces liangshanensis]
MPLRDLFHHVPPGPRADAPSVRRLRRGRVTLAVCLALAGTGGALALALPGTDAPRTVAERTDPADAPDAPADGLPHTAVEASDASETCGKGWQHPRAGLQVFDVRNNTTSAAEVYLTDTTGALLGEVDGLAPGTTRPIRVTLGRGTYTFRCLVEDTDAVTGAPVRISAGPARGGPAVLPVNNHDLIPVALAYQKWVAGGFGGVVDRVDTLRDAVDRGDLAAARKAWLPAHLAFVRLGGAYGAFGDLGSAVDGTDAGLPGGPHDPDFTGFHRVEYGLWHGEPAKTLRGPADRLAADVGTLRSEWADTRMDPLDLGLRTHEITEDSIQQDLTGRSDFGSGTSLASARAGLDGTAELVTLLRPLLTPRDTGLPRIDGGLRTTGKDLDALASRGGWRAPTALPRADRERIDADFGDLAEQLASVAVIFDVRRTS